MASPHSSLYDARSRAQAAHTRSRLEECWSCKVEWKSYPKKLCEGCKQVGKALSIPAEAVLAGILAVGAYFLSHSVIEVEETDWMEPVLLWVAIGMPTGSGKSALFKYLLNVIRATRTKCGLSDARPGWLLEDATFEKMGDLMHDNYGKLIGLYDELSSFLTQINLYRGKGLSESHDLALFLQLYNGNPWIRRTVCGDANFSMDITALTICGFTQPNVARNLIELQASVEKGLSPRFLWIFPKPTYAKFETLERVDENFTRSIVALMASLWNPNNTAEKKYKMPNPFPPYQKIYNNIQEDLDKLSGLDELLSGMLSKSKGQILRVAAVMHVLFSLDDEHPLDDDTPQDIPPEISKKALDAAENFVSVCLKHTAYMAGRGGLTDAIKQAGTGAGIPATDDEQAQGNATLSLVIPGKVLYLSALLNKRKFRKKGDKDGALAGLRVLEKANLGKVESTNPKRGTSAVYKFIKKKVPTAAEELEDFCASLMKFGVSLVEYKEAFEMPDITMESIEAECLIKKRVAEEALVTARKSPRRNLTDQFDAASE